MLQQQKNDEPAKKLCFIGDIGGHFNVFKKILHTHNIDPHDPVIPAELVLIQVGDLVHKGPDSAACVQLADTLLERNPSSYLQLVGNHEAHYLGGPDVSSRNGVEIVDRETQETIRRWWDSNKMSIAVAFVDKNNKQYLVTHGGLTEGLWKELGEPATAMETVSGLASSRSDATQIFRPGWLMTGSIDYSAGVTGPRTGAELAASWLHSETDMPFNQIHGHEGVWSWRKQTWHADVPPEVRTLSVINPVQRFSTVYVPGGFLKSIDWTLGESLPANFTPASWDIEGFIVSYG